MKLKDILAVSGKPGLFKFISQGRNGIIVESVLDNKRILVHSSNKVSALADIAIYTDSEEVPLRDVFAKIHEKESGKQTISHKSTDDQLKGFFEEIVENYDKSKVYTSDIKKVISWYNLLSEHNLFDPNEKEDEEEKSGTENESPEVSSEEKQVKPVKPESNKKTATAAPTKKTATTKTAAKTKAAGAKPKNTGTTKKPSA